jgi:protease II
MKVKNKVVIVEIDLNSKAQQKLEHFAHDRGYTVEQYVAECIHAKLHDMIDIPICVSYKIDTEE